MKMIIRKVVSKVLIIASIASSVVFSYPSHDAISSEIALNIANKSAKQLTFTDLGFKVGELEANWKLLSDSNFRVEQVLEETFTISATNTTDKKHHIF
jgi:hypothetical protein